jgi:beta-glucosidase
MRLKVNMLLIIYLFNISARAALLTIIGIMTAAAQSGPPTPPAPQPPPQDRALAILQKMTLDDKVNMLHGELNNFYGFYNAPIVPLGIPALTMADGPGGVRIADPNVNGQRATQLPMPIALAATWSPALAEQYGRLIGLEAHSTNHNVSLGPVLDIARVPQWGRVAETYGEDPLLAGTMGAADIRGIQSSPVISTLKHFLAYTQETNRLFNGNMIIDNRALQEIYARPVGIAIRDGNPGAAMCSFNKVNGIYACEDDQTINQILKTQLGFDGWIMTDYNARFSTVPAIFAGLDQDMPGNFTPNVGPGDCRFCGPLLDAVRGGEVPMSRIDDAVLRILRSMFEHGLFDTPPVVQPLPEADHDAESLAIAEKAMVLLKNDANALPLKGGITSIVVIGTDADVAVGTGGSGRVKPTRSVTLLEGIQLRAGAGVTVQHIGGTDPVTAVSILPGPDPVPSDFLTPPNGQGHGLRGEYFLNPTFSGRPLLDRTDPYAALNGGFFLFQGLTGGSPHFPDQPQSLNTNCSIRWTGHLTAPVSGSYEFALTTTGTSRMLLDGNLVVSTEPATVAGAVATATATVQLRAGSVHSVRVEFENDGPQQATDAGPQFKFGWTPPAGVVAPQAIAAAALARNAQAAIVVVRDYGGEGGDKSTLHLPNGQADLVRQVAAANPRTIVVLTAGGAVQTSDWDSAVPAILHSWYGGQEQGNAIARILFGDVNPSGRLPITMPVDDAHNPVSTPQQFPGVNLDSTFSEGIFVGYRGYEQFGLKPSYAFGHGLSYTTFNYSDLAVSASGLQINLKVENTGPIAGTETVQAYVGNLPTKLPTAPKALAGWSKVDLQPGETQDVIIQLNPESLSYWDVKTNGWVMPNGMVPIYIGSSSEDIRLTGKIQVGPGATSTTQSLQ